ncbi:MAG TPA: hypothetical protein VFF50_04185 [Candidatus Deferrimicrobiaceae bacterium]|nr:hypothetical protein [Candidatus Deferrimicrobiaceae bacterium]
MSATGNSLRQAPPSLSASGFGSPWFALCLAFGLHILDEAATGFLAIYNPTVTVLREHWEWFPMPMYDFRGWLSGLIVAWMLLICLTPVAARGMRGLRALAWIFAIVMFLNGVGHTVLSILGRTVSPLAFPHPAPDSILPHSCSRLLYG